MPSVAEIDDTTLSKTTQHMLPSQSPPIPNSKHIHTSTPTQPPLHTI